MHTVKLSFFLGVMLIVTGILVPSSALIESLRTIHVDLREQLLLGAVIFKCGLAIFGLFILIVGRMTKWNVEAQPAKPPPGSGSKKDLVILSAILLSAAALRLYALDSGLWFDEILTYVNYVKKPFGEIISTFDSQNQHPLYTLLAHASFLTFGESAWALRLPAVIFGVGSIWAVYLLGCQVSSSREALLSASLLVFSYHHIWFSQNARGYTGLLLWTVLSSWLFLRALDEGRPQLWFWYATTATLGVYTHMTMLFVIGGQFIIYLIELFRRRKEVWPNRWSGLVYGFCLAGFLTFQSHALVLPQILGGTLSERSTVAAWRNPLWTMLEFVRGMEISFAGGIVASLPSWSSVLVV